MKIVAIADTHEMHRELAVPNGDILIHAGDITYTGSLGALLDFNDWLGDLPHAYKIVIAGNHDRTLGQNWTLGLKMFTNAIYLQNSGVEIQGLKIWGSPWTPAFGAMRDGLTFYHAANGIEMKRVWAGMPKGLDILVTHGPPYGILDKVSRGVECNFQPEYCGDGMLAAKVIQKKPKYHIFGHIHEQHGKFKSDYGTTFLNASVVDEKYNLVYKPMVFHI